MKKNILCYPSHPKNGLIIFKWVSKDGFGEIVITKEKGEFYLDNEGMSKEHTKKMLCAMVDGCRIKKQ